MSKPLQKNQPAKTIPKATAASLTKKPPEQPNADETAAGLVTTSSGYSVPNTGQQPDQATSTQTPQESADTAKDPAVTLDPPPLTLDTRLGPITIPPVPMESGLGLVPARQRDGDLPPLPDKEPDGIVLSMGDPLIVEGVRINDTTVRVTKAVYRRVVAPGSKRWSHLLVASAGGVITGRQVRLISEMEKAAA